MTKFRDKGDILYMDNDDFKSTSPLFGANAPFIEELFEKYLKNPDSVDQEWQDFFAQNQGADNRKPSWAPQGNWVIGVRENSEEKKGSKKDKQTSSSHLNMQLLLEEYRYVGHFLSSLDPLGLEERNTEIEEHLDPKHWGFTDADYDRPIEINNENLGVSKATVSEFIEILKQVYCSHIGFEISHISSIEQKEWLYNKAEALYKNNTLSKEEKIHTLHTLIETDGFEDFLHTRFPGAKRFSIEGSDSAIVALDEIIKSAVMKGEIREAIVGMPHRGRLNVLTKIMGKSYTAMLSEFQGNLGHLEDLNISGDVKYHLGRSSDYKFGDGKEVHLSLAANPSHLEAVNSVVTGRVRAKQDLYSDSDRKIVMGILMHGDASFCGQGVVAESLSLSDLDGYCTGGTMHIVVNNQVGFTTSPDKQHTSRYPTEIAKIIQAPIIHVNGDDPEAVIHASRILEEFRRKFKKDVVLDLVSYRRYGHNEGDEPMFTQPLMYKRIKAHKRPFAIYAERLIREGVITQEDLDKYKKDFYKFLDGEYEQSKSYKPSKADWLEGKWHGLIRGHQGDVNLGVPTGVKLNKLKEIGKKLCQHPEGFAINSKLDKLLKNRLKNLDNGKDIDWATAEALAYGSLLAEKISVRLSGQDSGRGTFSHRHSVLTDQENENTYIPLNHINDDQAHFQVVDSNLSEFAVLGFEYGFSIVDPKCLTIWEGQFGDFANGAQVIMDQFISSAEVKWQRMSGLVMLLPHGYEGQGPEHSSARMERYLQLCAEGNMQVVNCTTPANFFHVIRRQIHRDFRKPLIVMSPKSLLRHKKVISDLKDFDEKQKFATVIGEAEKISPSNKIRRVIMCTGKVYYDLLEEREKKKIKDIAIIRVEQIYPFPKDSAFEILKLYKNASEVIWCQEEPKNMGAWRYICHYIENVLIRAGGKAKRPIFVGRPNAASPAAGYMKIHVEEQATLVSKALGKKL